MKALVRISILSAALATTALSQAGLILNPGGSAVLPVEEYEIASTVLDTKVREFSIVNAAGQTRATGTAISQVVREAQSGTLTFLYLVQNNGSSLDELNRITVTNFAGWATEVGQDVNNNFSPRQNASLVSRSANGATIGFDFLAAPIGQGMLSPGKWTSVFWIRTNATDYTSGTLNAIDGGIATVDSFAPVPEPGTMAALGLGALALLRRRRKA